MPATFGSIWRQLHLENPSVDPLLCRSWIQEAYKQAATLRQWGFLRAEGRLVNEASRSVTAGVTYGDATVTSAAAFLSTDVGRQFRVGGIGIPYTIQTFTSTSSVELDGPYRGATAASADGTILDAYVTLPVDVDSIRSLVNPENYRPMPWFLDRTILDYCDPNRTATAASARMLACGRMSTITGQTGRMVYEWWPYPTARNQYPFTYYQKPESITDTDEFVGALSDRAEVLLHYGRMRAALYPGTVEAKNPGFNPAAARIHDEEWKKSLETVAVRDDDQFIQSIDLIDWRWVGMGLPFDTQLLRATDASGWESWLGAGNWNRY